MKIQLAKTQTSFLWPHTSVQLFLLSRLTQLCRQHNSSSTTTVFPPYKLDVLLRARSTSSRPVLRSPQFRSVQYDAQNINRHTVFSHARTMQELDRHTVLSANKSNAEFLACTTQHAGPSGYPAESSPSRDTLIQLIRTLVLY